MTARHPAPLVAAMVGAQVLTMLGISAFAALLPQFQQAWGLSNTEAGWIGAAFFAGYTAAVPVLTALTDRVDPKRIYLLSAVLTAGANLGFALFADGVVSAVVLRAVAGIGLAGTYMPGLKALSDQVDARHLSRATAVYVSGFGLGTSLSYPFAGLLAGWAGWPAAFVGAALAAVVAAAIVLAALPRAPASTTAPRQALLDVRPVLRNRSALAYTLCYTAHNWELFGFRAWIVAFLVFAAARHGVTDPLLPPTVAAAAITLFGLPASILGNELSIRFGRRRTVAIVMATSAVVCFTIGFSAGIAYPVALLIALIHGLTVIGDSSAVTAGALGNAASGQRGATMAVHSTVGFLGAVCGPLAFGAVLDLVGGDGVLAWGLAFAHMGLIMLAGPLVLAVLRPTALVGDRESAPRPPSVAGSEPDSETSATMASWKDDHHGAR